MAFVLIGIVSIASFNIAGITVTKYLSSLTRSIVDVIRTIIVWLIGIIITVTIGREEQNYRWESVNIRGIGVELVGFMILVIGNLIYNKVIKNDYLLDLSE